MACVGVGGKGYFTALEVSRTGANIVALCDTDTQRTADSFELFPKAQRYSDFRRLLDQERDNIDAVVISTPDHFHVPASVMAMRTGKHVYCEKPLGQNIADIRLATQVAREIGVVTQIGNGAHSGSNYRGVANMVKEDVIGEVREVYCCCDDDKGMPPNHGKQAWRNRPPPQTPPVPKYLHWDLWLGPAPYRPYHPAYHPLAWRDFWDFGNGRLGDIGIHVIDLPFWAWNLTRPTSVEAEGPPVNPEGTPSWMFARWTFPARGDLPPVEMTSYHGGKPLQTSSRDGGRHDKTTIDSCRCRLGVHNGVHWGLRRR